LIFGLNIWDNPSMMVLILNQFSDILESEGGKGAFSLFHHHPGGGGA